MIQAKKFLAATALKRTANYARKNPDKNLPIIMGLLERFASQPKHMKYIESGKRIVNDKNSSGYKMIQRAFTELQPKVLENFLVNFMVNSAFVGNDKVIKLREKHQCNIPWAILMDPTSACNLNCTGCWAAEYEKKSSLSYDILDRIIAEGKELGIYMYIYSGGEPLMRKKDLIKLARKHNDCAFLSFSNGTLVDEGLAADLADVANFALAFSIDGFEGETDITRGKGTFKKVVNAMDLLKKNKAPFGFSSIYHSRNAEVVGSEKYVDFLIDKGCFFGWYFTYIPLGQHAELELLAMPEQREYMYYQVRKMRKTKPIFLMDFWNDGEFVNGCIAGGRSYLHINASGDVEPCAFIHYANVNIKEVSLFEALQSPIFMQYRKYQPFNSNHLRPCPLLDNPDMLKKMVHESNAYSTQYIDRESVDDLTDKCQEISRLWAKTADRLWKESGKYVLVEEDVLESV
jgi:MoaA/NifB/PqqE/SkfB family radical SAM enzyme